MRLEVEDKVLSQSNINELEKQIVLLKQDGEVNTQAYEDHLKSLESQIEKGLFNKVANNSQFYEKLINEINSKSNDFTQKAKRLRTQ